MQPTKQENAQKKNTDVKRKPMDPSQKEILVKIANTVRILSMDAVQKANSGHPGLPMGCAELGAYLWGYAMKYNPKDPKWFNRDRFVLSAGHGSMWLYSFLHLSGYKVSLEDLKQFRQLHSITPGHPESLDTEGVETTTGPLGQGVGNAIGMALGYKCLAAKFNTDKHTIINNKIYCLMSDGDAMEGVNHEVCALAGHLRIDNITVFYDANNVTLDGFFVESASENTKERFLAYGWEVFEMDGNDLDQIDAMFKTLDEKKQDRPRLVITHTIIGKGSPNKAGTHKAHGSPLGPEEVKASKLALGVPEEPFYIYPEVKEFFKNKIPQDAALQENWKKTFDAWAKEYPDKLRDFEAMNKQTLPKDLRRENQGY